MSKHALPFLILCVWGATSTPALSQNHTPALQWYSWSEGIAKAAKENKKILLYVYASPCGWCKKMESETFSHAEVVQSVKTDFIPVKLNAAENAELEFRGKTYRMVNSGTRVYNALAAEMLEGRMSFPSIVFMDESQQVLQSIAGFKPSDEFLPMTTYYGKDYYKTMPWSAFQKKHPGGR